MKRQILTREQLRCMSPQAVMAAYRAGALDVLTNFGEVTDDLTKDAVELVLSMEEALGAGERNVADTVEKVTEAKRALS